MNKMLSTFASSKWNTYLFVGLFATTFFVATPAVSLFLGILYALLIGNPIAKWSKSMSKRLLQYSVVGLGFGMNLHESLQAGREGMIFTIVSVVVVMVAGVLIGRMMGVGRKSSYLIASGTAICGGSAIAAVSPVIGASEEETSMSLATIFVLNAVALFLFPVVGHWLALSQVEFGTWAAIAIHDTSSVVGAGAAYGEEALRVATTVKLTRALWIIPLSLVSALIFKQKGGKISIPYFILFFVVAMILNTYLPIPEVVTSTIYTAARMSLSATLFLIGGGLSLGVVRSVGAKPLILGVTLWILISVISLVVVIFAS